MTKRDDQERAHANPALTEALRAASLPRRKPTADDAVPAQREPMTRAQRIALDYAKQDRQRADEPAAERSHLTDPPSA